MLSLLIWCWSLSMMPSHESACFAPTSCCSASAMTAGAVWEHLLTMIRCPFLALSATIGNPEQVHGWLKSLKDLQKSQDAARNDHLPSPAGSRAQAHRRGPGSKSHCPTAYDVSLVSHRVRHADLRLYVYQPRDEPHFNGIASLQPVSCLPLQ